MIEGRQRNSRNILQEFVRGYTNAEGAFAASTETIETKKEVG
jgi:hypothetical protein